MSQIDSFLDRIVTCDEKWVLSDNDSSYKWVRHKTAHSDPKTSLYPCKALLSVRWNMQDVMFFGLLPNTTTITTTKYCHQLDNVSASHKSKHLAQINSKGGLPQDGARPHIASMTYNKIRDLG